MYSTLRKVLLVAMLAFGAIGTVAYSIDVAYADGDDGGPRKT